MNDKINNLALQCWDGDDFDFEKFAKLIVKECIGVIKETNLIDDDPVVRIKEHFGEK